MTGSPSSFLLSPLHVSWQTEWDFLLSFLYNILLIPSPLSFDQICYFCWLVIHLENLHVFKRSFLPEQPARRAELPKCQKIVAMFAIYGKLRFSLRMWRATDHKNNYPKHVGRKETCLALSRQTVMPFTTHQNKVIDKVQIVQVTHNCKHMKTIMAKIQWCHNLLIKNKTKTLPVAERALFLLVIAVLVFSYFTKKIKIKKKFKLLCFH